MNASNQLSAHTPGPSEQQIHCLREYAAINGRYWKSALRHSWETGVYQSNDESATLQQIRNQFGPSWLAKFNPHKASTWTAKAVTP